MKRLIMIAGIALLVAVAVCVAGWNGNAPRSGTFTGGSASYTNEQPFRVSVLAVMIYAEGLASTNAIVRVVNSSVTNAVLPMTTTVTNCAVYSDGAGAVALNVGGILEFATTMTNTVRWSVNTR